MDGSGLRRDNLLALVEFLLLGPLEAVESGQPVPLGGRQQRALLAALLLRPNEVVPADQLIDGLWGERPPPTASTVVQLYVSRLRKLFGRDRFLTRPGGYELAIEPSRIDAGRFEALLAAAHETVDAAETARLLREALALWRGPALVDFAYDEFAAAESRRLEELRLAALEDRIDADLALGRDAELVGETEALLAGQPLRERLRGQLMLALYRSGRQAEALAVYRDGRHALVEELGLEPSPALRDLERRILDHDPALEAQPRREPRRAVSEERKVVTALFADLAGFGETALDPEEAQAVLDPLAARVGSELERFGGTIETLVGGTVAAVFGVPVAHEDDPERAVRAALACRDVVAEAARADPTLQFEVRIAVDTGEVLVDGDGQVVGEAVSTADRLRMGAPANAVLVAEATHRATAAAIEYVVGQPIPTPGRPEPIGVWQAVAPISPIHADRTPARDVALVGREGELDLFHERLRATAADGRAQFLTLVGAPGIGKTRLLREARLAAEGFRWLHGRSIPYGDGVAYWAFAEIVKTVGGILDTDAPARAEEKLRRAVRETVAEDPEWVEEQLRVLLGLQPRDLASARPAAFAAWNRFLAGLAAQRPLVLALEDIHWADEGLLDFVEQLRVTATAMPLLVVCTARPELLERRPGWGPVVELSPLSTDDTRTLLRALVGLESLSDELETVVSRVGGNPLFAEEYARALADGETDDLRLPDSVHQVIAARLDTLAPETKAVLQNAAVVGEVFWPGALSSIGGLEPSVCARRLEELTRHDFVAPEPRSAFANELQHAFKHVLIRDVAYAGIPRANRAAKHRQTAEWIESRSRDDDVAELVAHHYASALELARATRQETEELVERTAEALWSAGERAGRLYANAEAAGYFRRALALLNEATSADPEWLAELAPAVGESLSDVFMRVGEHEQAEAELAQAELLVPPGDRVRRARLLRKRGYSCRLQRRSEDEAEFYRAGEAALGTRPLGQAWWEERCHIAVGWLGMLASRPPDQLENGLTTYRPIVEQHGTAEQRSHMLGWVGEASLRRERYVSGEETLDYFRAGLAAGRESGIVMAVMWARASLGFALLLAGRLDEAEVELTEALALAERAGDTFGRASCLAYLTMLHRKRGDVAGAHRVVENALEAARAAPAFGDSDDYVAHAQANLAWIAWRKADYSRAEELAREAWNGWDAYSLQRVFAWVPVFPLLGLALRAGRHDEALELAGVVLDRTRQALPPELEESLRAGRLTEAAALAAGHGYL